MHWVKQWALGICVFSVIVSVMKMIVPGKSLAKSMSLSVRLFLLLIIIWPFADMSSEWESVYLQTEAAFYQNDYDMTETALILACENLQNQISLTLQNENIPYSKVIVQLHIENDNRISFCEVIVVTDTQETAVKQVIQDHYGLEATVKKVDTADIEQN